MAVTATATEINLIDGGATVGTTAIADGDGLLINDAGTMRVSTVQTLAAYLDDEITAMPNLTSVGTLTALTVDDVAVDGKVITMTGSSGDTFVTTVAANGATSLVTTDAAAAAANFSITADGTVDIDSAGVLTLDSGAAINIEPAAGSAILLDGTISVDAGVVTGATSITSTAFVGGLTGNVTGNASGTALTVTQAAQSAITSLGTLTTLTVDEMTLNTDTLTATDTFTVDAVDDITLNSDNSGRILFGDASVIYGIASNSSSDFVLEVGTNDKDMLFKGQDGGASVTALTLDMSAEGTATFNSNINIAGDDTKLKFGANSEIELIHYHNAGLMLKNTNDGAAGVPHFILQSGDTDIAANDYLGTIQFQAPDEGTGTDAILIAAAIDARAEGNFAADNNATSLHFRTGASETATDKLVIKSDGRGLSQFTAKAWVNFNGDGTVAIRDSHNVSSITDNGTGNYNTEFTNNVDNTNYAVVSNTRENDSDNNLGNSGPIAYNVTSAQVLSCNSANNSPQDPLFFNVVVFGD